MTTEAAAIRARALGSDISLELLDAQGCVIARASMGTIAIMRLEKAINEAWPGPEMAGATSTFELTSEGVDVSSETMKPANSEEVTGF